MAFGLLTPLPIGFLNQITIEDAGIPLGSRRLFPLIKINKIVSDATMSLDS